MNLYPEIKLPKIVNYQEIEKLKSTIVLLTGPGSHLYQRLDKIAEGNDNFLKLRKSDLVMVIAPPINGHEKFASRAEDKVAEITTNLVDISRDNFYDAKPADQDIMKTLETLKPKYFFPIRGLYCYLSIASKLARKTGMAGDKVAILQNAKVAVFQDNKLISQKEIIKDSTEIIIDGLGIGDIAPSVIHEREVLARDGLLIVTIILDRKTHKLKHNIEIQTEGLVSPISKDSYLELIKERINKVLDSLVELDGNNDSKKVK
jgi:ribonuclease J